MQSKEEDGLIFIRLFPGEDIYHELEEVCQKHKVKTAVVLSGVGQLKQFELGYFKEKTPDSLQYVIHDLFETITLFQPMADNLNMDRFYLIAENFSGTANDWIQILSSEDINLDIPEDFYDYLDKFNQEYLDLTEFLKTQEFENDHDRSSGTIYNIYKCKSLWNIF